MALNPSTYGKLLLSRYGSFYFKQFLLIFVKFFQISTNNKDVQFEVINLHHFHSV